MKETNLESTKKTVEEAQIILKEAHQKNIDGAVKEINEILEKRGLSLNTKATIEILPR